MFGRTGSPLLEFPITLPQIQGQFALKTLQLQNLAANLGEFVVEQIADFFAGISPAISQIEKMFDLLQGEAEGLHLPDEVETDYVSRGVEPKLTSGSRRYRQQRAALIKPYGIDSQCGTLCRLADLHRTIVPV